MSFDSNAVDRPSSSPVMQEPLVPEVPEVVDGRGPAHAAVSFREILGVLVVIVLADVVLF